MYSVLLHGSGSAFEGIFVDLYSRCIFCLLSVPKFYAPFFTVGPL